MKFNKRLISVSFAALIFSGCASVAVNEASLEQRTAHALGLAASDFTISDRSDSGIRTDYLATTKTGQKYSCYVTGTFSVVGRVVSDAMCTQQKSAGGKAAPAPAAKAGKPAAANCNALLKAAGKC